MINIISLFAAGSAGCDKSGGFLGLEPWWHYLPADRFGQKCEIVKFNVIHGKSDIPLVLLAVVDDMLRISAIVAIGYVMAGAFKYVASQGDPEATSRAQSTIQNALLGLAIATVAVAFVSFIGSKLGS